MALTVSTNFLVVCQISPDPAIIKETVALEERLSKQTIQKILWDNPRRFYGL
ncbi:hypothetical protein BGP_2620 [Beggiatoa sp. PS]|nr:hypothetical protein BGP_2620 [Beggiatoa sp. PS]